MSLLAFITALLLVVNPGAASAEENNPDSRLVGLIEAAEKMFSDGNYEDAEKAFMQIVFISPNNPAGHLGLGRIFLLEGNDSRALESLKKAAELAPDSADVHFELGSTYLSLNMVDEAIKQLNIASSISPDRPEFQYKLSQARSLKEATMSQSGSGDDSINLNIDRASDLGVVFRLATSGRVQEAISQAHKAVSSHPDSPSLHYQLGLLYKALNDLDNSKQQFSQALNLNPDYYQALDQLTNIYISMNECEKASNYLKHWIEIDPDNPTAHFNQAWCQILKGSFQDAKVFLKTSVRLDPRNTDLLNHYGLVLRELGDDRSAANIFRRALSLDPVARSPRLNLAMIYLSDAAPSKADEVIDALRHQSYQSPDILAVSSLVHAKLEKMDAATKEADEAFKFIPDHPVALVAKALVLAFNDNTDEAIELLESAHTKYPDNIFVLQELSETYSQLGKFDESVAIAREAKKLNPDRIQTDELLMFNLAKQKKIKEAQKVLSEISGLSKKNREILKGKIYEMSGNRTRAVSYYKSLLKKNPFFEEAHTRLADIYFQRNKLKDASKHYFQVVDHNGGNIEARLMLARINLIRRKYKTALAECNQIIEIDQNNGSVNELIGRAQLGLRNYDKALDAFKSYKTTANLEPESIIAFAIVQKKLKNYNGAWNLVNEAKQSSKLTDKMKKQLDKLAKDLPPQEN